MTRSLLPAALLLVLANSAQALEIKNVRNCYAPAFWGSTRPNLKIMGPDFIFITYEVDGLKPHSKTGKLSFTSTLELIDAAGKQLFSKETPSEILPQLGSAQVPGEVNIEIPPSQKPGKYKIKMTVYDKEGKDSKAFEYPFDVLDPAFGMVGVQAPSFGLIGTYHTTRFGLVNMKLDDKKLCKVDLLMRVLDDTGKELSKIESKFPRDLPPDIELDKANLLPCDYPIYLNRVGRFTIEVSAKDVAGGGTLSLSYPFRVIDAVSILGK
jgi:hypothetical protein